MVSKRIDSTSFLGDQLIHSFASCGSLEEANQAFSKVSKPTLSTWKAIIFANAKLGGCERAIELYREMQEGGFRPDKFVYSCILKACASVGAIGQGRHIHDQIRKSGLQFDVVVGNTLIHLYCKCGTLQEARKVFDELPDRDPATWATMIAGYAQCGCGLLALQLFQKFQEEGLPADKVTFLFTLKACGSMGALSQGRLIHEQISRANLEPDVMVASTVLDMYAKCGSLQEARRVFDSLTHQDSVSWSAMIAGYAEHGYGLAALELFERMQEDGIKPNKFTYSCALKACGTIRVIRQGRIVHDQIVRNELKLDVAIGNTLIDMYARCGSIEEAQDVFDELTNRNLISWGTMITGYSQHGCGLCALKLFEKMQHSSTKPDNVIFLCIVKACGSIGAIVQGRLIHDQIIRSGLTLDVFVGNTLVDMYAKCKSLEEAHKVFDKLPHRNVVSWGAIIAGYAQHGYGVFALKLFQKMQLEHIMPDKVTFLCILKACGNIGAVGQGRLLHDQIVRRGLQLGMVIGSALVDMYSKCDCLDDSHRVFVTLPKRDVVSWGAMIAGYIHCGNWTLVTQSLAEMGQQGLKPNYAIYSSILIACSRAGLLEEGGWYFTCMREDYGIAPDVNLYSCMVDLLGRGGLLYEAEDLLQSMPTRPSIVAWTSLLTSCKTHNNMELGRLCFDEVIQITPTDASGYVLMSNIYADSQMLQDVEVIADERRSAGAFKKPGTSWIEIQNRVHEFIVADANCPQSDGIHAKLKVLSTQLKKEGYMPQLDSVLDSILDEVKVDALCGNS